MARWSLVVALLGACAAAGTAFGAAISIVDDRGDAKVRTDDLMGVDVTWSAGVVSFRISYYARRDRTSYPIVELNAGGGAKPDLLLTNDEEGAGLYTAGPRARLVAKAALRIAGARALVYTVPAKRLPRVLSFRVVSGDDRAPDSGWEPLAI